MATGTKVLEAQVLLGSTQTTGAYLVMVKPASDFYDVYRVVAENERTISRSGNLEAAVLSLKLDKALTETLIGAVERALITEELGRIGRRLAGLVKKNYNPDGRLVNYAPKHEDIEGRPGMTLVAHYADGPAEVAKIKRDPRILRQSVFGELAGIGGGSGFRILY